MDKFRLKTAKSKLIKITSHHNQLIKEAIRLKEKPDRRKNSFIIEGPRLIQAALEAGAGIETVFFTERFARRNESGVFLDDLIEKVLLSRSGAEGQAASGMLVAEITEDILSRLADTGTPQGVVAVVSYVPPDMQEIVLRDAPFFVVCDGVADPGNLGTIIRIADAAGADCVVALPGTCNAFSPKCIRATAGSLFNVPVTYSDPVTFLAYLKKREIPLYVADAHAERSLYSADFRGAFAIVFGNESCGVSEALKLSSESAIRIPIMGRAESLNVAMSASVCLYEAARQRLAAG